MLCTLSPRLALCISSVSPFLKCTLYNKPVIQEGNYFPEFSELLQQINGTQEGVVGTSRLRLVGQKNR